MLLGENVPPPLHIPPPAFKTTPPNPRLGLFVQLIVSLPAFAIGKL